MPIKGLLWRFILPLLGTTAVLGGVAAAARFAPGPWRQPWAVAGYTILASMVLVLAARWRRRRGWRLPVRRLQLATARMARGEWDVRVQPLGAEAVRQLAENINSLAGQAQKQLSELAQQRGGLQTLVDTLPDAILAVDAQGRITLLNAPAGKLFSLPPQQALRQKLVSVVNDEQVVEFYEALLGAGPAAERAPLHREIRLVREGQRCIFQAVASRAGGGGALLVLRDVSTLAGAVQMKSDFVANASHELRTPIAAIKIAFETLRDVYREDPVQSERCISVIDDHLRRLEEMLRDLLDLSRVERSDLQPRVTAVKTADLLAAVKATMGALARQKNVELGLGDGEAAVPSEFRTDSRLINLVLKNLVENSIKFTPAGGKVTVTIQHTAPDRIALRVADTGIGIAPEHLDRVFERFYQVDSARSGSAGRGTGLGLAIVKHAVNALGGSVKLESVLGKGTTVTCEFPRSEVRAAEIRPAAS